MDSLTASDAVSNIERTSADEILLRTYGLTDEEVERVNVPAAVTEYSAANGKTAQISPGMLASVLMLQSLIAPFVIFILLMMSAQMIMTAISNEKIDKTLETLMSTPVSRLAILGRRCWRL
jgi:ABC-2 type transport system permease protein